MTTHGHSGSRTGGQARALAGASAQARAHGAAAIRAQGPEGPAQGRLLYLDMLRCLAIFAVVLMHCAMPLLGRVDDRAALWAGLAYAALCIFCVPLLLMISGALILGDTRPMDTRTFYRRRLSKIVIPLLVWSAVYYGLNCLTEGSTVNVVSFLKRTLAGLWAGPLWFLYMMAGVYLMVPFLKPAFADPRAGRTWAFVAVLFGLQTLNFLVKFLWSQELNRFLTRAVFPYYFGYFVLGYALNATPVRVPGGKATLLAGVILPAACMAVGEYQAHFSESLVPNLFFNYQGPLTAIMAGSVFLLFKGRAATLGKPWAGLLRTVSGLTYGVFLTHIAVLMLLTGTIPWVFAPGHGLDVDTLGPWAGPLLTAVNVFVLSALLTYVLRRLPFIRRAIP